MTFLLVEIAARDQELAILGDLTKLPFFRVKGDWHEHSLRKVLDSGLSDTSAPALSIIEDRKQNGRSAYVAILLTNGAEAVGQLRSTGLLVSAELAPDDLANDVNVSGLLARLRILTGIKRVEVA
jgi:hypothetical protein